MEFTAQELMDPGSRTDKTFFKILISSVDVGETGSGFGGDDGSGGDIILVQTKFPVTVKASGGDLADIKGGRTGTADLLKLGHDL